MLLSIDVVTLPTVVTQITIAVSYLTRVNDYITRSQHAKQCHSCALVRIIELPGLVDDHHEGVAGRLDGGHECPALFATRRHGSNAKLTS
jgi:hypothetical protein